MDSEFVEIDYYYLVINEDVTFIWFDYTLGWRVSIFKIDDSATQAFQICMNDFRPTSIRTGRYSTTIVDRAKDLNFMVPNRTDTTNNHICPVCKHWSYPG